MWVYEQPNHTVFTRGLGYEMEFSSLYGKSYNYIYLVQWNLDLRKLDLRKNLDLGKIVGTTDFLVHKLFDLRKIF